MPETTPAITSQVLIEGVIGEISKPIGLEIVVSQNLNSSQAESEREVK